MNKDEHCGDADVFVSCSDSNCFQYDDLGRGTGHEKFIWLINLINVFYQNMVAKILFLKLARVNKIFNDFAINFLNIKMLSIFFNEKI